MTLMYLWLYLLVRESCPWHTLERKCSFTKAKVLCPLLESSLQNIVQNSVMVNAFNNYPMDIFFMVNAPFQNENGFSLSGMKYQASRFFEINWPEKGEWYNSISILWCKNVIFFFNYCRPKVFIKIMLNWGKGCWFNS